MSSIHKVQDLSVAEEWRDIPEYEGLYQVSNTGKVKRLSGNVLTPSGPYLHVSLSKQGIVEKAYVHHMVADVFIGPRPDGMQVCHDDGNSRNPRLDNLRYDTPTGNASDRHRHGTHAKGEKNPGNKYSEEEIANIKHDLLNFPQFKVAEIWGIPKPTIRSISQGKRWGDVDPIPEEPYCVGEFY